MSLVTAITQGFDAIAAKINTLNARQGSLADLTTTQRGSLVSAINEVRSTAITPAQVDARFEALVGGAPAALDTLGELAAAISAAGGDGGAAVTAALADRVAYSAQSKSASEQAQARANIDVWGKSEIGSVDTDFAAGVNAAVNF